jgi:transposase-like protein
MPSAHASMVRLLLRRADVCPYCRCGDVRETRRSVTRWERLLKVRRYRCQGCWRRLLVFRGWSREPRDGRIYNRG